MSSKKTSLRLFKYADNFNTYVAGAKVFGEGDPGNCMYVVKSGTVELRCMGQLLERLGPGDILGEMALVDAEPRSATASALTDCQLVPIDIEKFQYMVRETPYFA